MTGNCTQHHREVAIAIKTARELALLPYTQRTVVERAGGRSLRVSPGAEREPMSSAPPVPSAPPGAGRDGDEATGLGEAGPEDEIPEDEISEDEIPTDAPVPDDLAADLLGEVGEEFAGESRS